MAGDVGDPGSWNRYAYVLGDPVNYYDPRGMQASGPRFVCASGSEEGLSLDCWWEEEFTPGPIGSPPRQKCDVDKLVDPDELAAVAVVMGENSFPYTGKAAYQPGDVFGQPTGPIITGDTVRAESAFMVVVLANRAATKGYPGSTIAATAAAKGQFLGYSAGKGFVEAGLLAFEGESACERLKLAVEEVRSVLASLDSYAHSFYSWKATVDENNSVRPLIPGEVWIGRTAFQVD